MSIREVEESDLNQLADLFDRYRVFYGKHSEIEKGKLFLAERIKNGDSKIYVAENTEKVLTGFIQLYPIFSSTRLQRLWLLNDLYVASDYRGNKISILLIDQAKKFAVATNSCGLLLETEKENRIGNRLYVKTGFLLDTNHNYYSWSP